MILSSVKRMSKLLNNLLNIKKILEKLFNNCKDMEDSETIEMFNYALETSNSLICKKYHIWRFAYGFSRSILEQYRHRSNVA